MSPTTTTTPTPAAPYAVVALCTLVAVLAYPALRLILKMLGQIASLPGGGKRVVGGGYGGAAGEYTVSEVAKHDTKDDLWVVIKGKVYDLTEYADEHPGGVAAITKHAGGDATAGFFGPQHPSRVHDMVDEYKIGVIVDEGKAA
uniref:Cytochrome b5 heme-binding domain-containing protein n=2 Tax=Micromonas pusilla TaxID=38833 RepID=A0A7R9XTV7_MICPS|mmetsp:Transcript_10817/g.39184  ORF Transcript_10817/g.39184 Transcript_10817/m.39184 type:complete len:144 (+) Transcript_10817:58-489(+)